MSSGYYPVGWETDPIQVSNIDAHLSTTFVSGRGNQTPLEGIGGDARAARLMLSQFCEDPVKPSRPRELPSVLLSVETLGARSVPFTPHPFVGCNPQRPFSHDYAHSIETNPPDDVGVYFPWHSMMSMAKHGPSIQDGASQAYISESSVTEPSITAPSCLWPAILLATPHPPTQEERPAPPSSRGYRVHRRIDLQTGVGRQCSSKVTTPAWVPGEQYSSRPLTCRPWLPAPQNNKVACHSCRDRKIKCAKGGKNTPGEICDPCRKRQWPCGYPTASRRGVHRKRSKGYVADLRY